MIVRRRKPIKEKKQDLNLPFLTLLRTSWNHQVKEFLEKSTLHGIRYVAETERPFLERFMWFCFIMVGGAVALIIVVSLWDKFQTNPTITGLDMDFHNWDVPFPAITLCPQNPVNETHITEYIFERWGNVSEETLQKYTTFLTRVGNLSYENLAEFDVYRNDVSLPQGNLRDLLNQVVLRCEDLIEYCLWKDEPYDCCSGFFPLLSENGFCYTFNNERVDYGSWPWLTNANQTKTEYIYETDSNLQLSFNVLSSFGKSLSIYIHNNNEIPDVEFFPQYVWTGQRKTILFSAKHTYTMDDVRQLTIQQRRCVFEDEIKLITDHVYTFSACMAQCRMHFSFSKCGCIPLFYKQTKEFRHCNLQGLGCLAQYARELKADLSCNCELGCVNTVYEVEKLDGEEKQQEMMTSSKPELTAGFLSWPTVRYKREVLFGWVDLLVAFGGIAGLFLGFSLLSGIEILYYFTLRAFCMVHTDKHRLSQLHQENLWEKQTQLVNLDLEQFLFGQRKSKLGEPNKASLSHFGRQVVSTIDSAGFRGNDLGLRKVSRVSDPYKRKDKRTATAHCEIPDRIIPYLP